MICCVLLITYFSSLQQFLGKMLEIMMSVFVCMILVSLAYIVLWAIVGNCNCNLERKKNPSTYSINANQGALSSCLLFVIRMMTMMREERELKG